MSDVIGLVLIGVGSIMIWIGVHGHEASLSSMLNEFFSRVKSQESGGNA
ncbi:hypothetical protein ACPCTO_03240 [Streptomyces olivoreticuli]